MAPNAPQESLDSRGQDYRQGESKDEMVHTSFVQGFLSSHLALISGMADDKDIH